MSKFQRAILFSVAGLMLLLLASSIYFFAATGGEPVSKSDLDTLKARVGAVEAESNYAAVKADSAYDYVVALGGFCGELQKDGKGYKGSIDSIKNQIEILKKRNGGVIDKKARADIEKIKAAFQSRDLYTSKRDSASAAEALKTKSMIDSLVNKSKVVVDPMTNQGLDQKPKLPNDPGNGQDYPKKKKGKKKEYLPKNNDPGNYQNFNKAPVN